MKINLEFKEKELDIIASTQVPPLVYTLPEGTSRSSILYPERVGDWKLMWVNTNGKKDKGSLMLVPLCLNNKRKLFNTRVKYYMGFGFKEYEATILAKTNIPKYWCRNNMAFLFGLASGQYGIACMDDLRSALPELAMRTNISNTDAIRNYVLLEKIHKAVQYV